MAPGMVSRRFAIGGLAATGLIGLVAPARAYRGLSNLILVVPFAAGGSADIMARIVGQRLGELLKVSVVIENRGGAGGNLAASYVAKSRPGASPLLWGTISTHALNPLISRTVNYDPVRDFEPVSLLVTLPNVMLVNPQVPARTVREMITLLKAEPEKYSFASSGIGTPLHLSGELFNLQAGTRMRHVPYRGASPALNDVVAGHVPVMFDTLASASQHIQSGALRALAITTKQRSTTFPNVPTMDEAGLPGYETYAWHALFCPPGTPADVIADLNAAVRSALKAPETLAKLNELGATVDNSTPAELEFHIKAEIQKWTPIVQAAKISID